LLPKNRNTQETRRPCAGPGFPPYRQSPVILLVRRRWCLEPLLPTYRPPSVSLVAARAWPARPDDVNAIPAGAEFRRGGRDAAGASNANTRPNLSCAGLPF